MADQDKICLEVPIFLLEWWMTLNRSIRLSLEQSLIQHISQLLSPFYWFFLDFMLSLFDLFYWEHHTTQKLYQTWIFQEDSNWRVFHLFTIRKIALFYSDLAANKNAQRVYCIIITFSLLFCNAQKYILGLCNIQLYLLAI